MNNYTIAETYTLPSLGKIYDYEVNPQVTLKSMTTEQEQKRLAITDFPYKMLCEIIDDCIVDDIGISSYDMCIGDYQFLLYKLRTVTYGAEYSMNAKCPYCGYTRTETVNLDELKRIEYTEDIDKYRKFEVPKTKVVIELNVQTPRMLDSNLDKVREYKKKFPEASDPSLTYTLKSLIKTIDGKKPDPLKVDQWIKDLPMADVNTIITYAEKFNSSIGLDTSLIFKCDVCGLYHESALSISQEFFRPALHI